MISATDVDARDYPQLPRSPGHYVPPELLLLERALKYCPIPDIPLPYIPYSYIPLSRELVIWWYFFHYIAFLYRPLEFVLKTAHSPTLAVLLAVACSLVLRFPDSVLRLFCHRLPTVLRLLAWAGYTTQTITNAVDAAHTADLLDCIVVVVLLALLVAVWTTNWPRLAPLRHTLHGLVGPITRGQTPYLANWGSQALRFVLATRRSPEEYLVGIPVKLLLWSTVLVDSKRNNSIADYQRRRYLGADASALNPATRIPPEVQLQIFHLVRKALRFGADERPWNPDGVSDLLELPFARPGPAAACAVCRAWRDAATEVLYTDIILCRTADTVALARVLAHRPALARFARSIAFADDATWAPRAMEEIVRHCAGATRLTFARTHPAVLELPALSRLLSLDITGGHDDAAPAGTYRLRELDVSSVLARCPHLESLALRRYTVRFTHDDMQPAVPTLRALCLDCCALQVSALVRLLRALPRVRAVELRNLSVPTGVALDVDILFSEKRGSLRELLLASTFRHMATASLIALPGVCQLSALRRLAVNARELPQLHALPPALEHLAVSFSPYSAWERACRRSVLSAVHSIRTLAPSAPALRSVRLTDEVFLIQIPAWKVAAFMLRESLVPARVEVQVNLHLHWEDLRWYHVRLHFEKRLFAFLNW